jgi:hypothetical protein
MSYHLLLLLAVLQAHSSVATDPCVQKLPPSLRTAFSKAFPGYRQVLVSDYDIDTVERERSYHAGSPCIAVEAADFNVDGRKDFVFLALHPKKTVRAFVGLGFKRGWHVQQLWDLKSTYPSCCYANVLPPGSYENVYGTEPDPESPPAPDELLALTATAQGAIVGATESTGVGFFLVNQRWVHIWLSD